MIFLSVVYNGISVACFFPSSRFNVSTSTWSKQLPTLILFENGKEVARRPFVDSKNRVAAKFVFSDVSISSQCK